MVAALPHVDAFLAGNSLASLEQLAALLESGFGRMIGGLVLAAGEGRRFGGAKLAAELDGASVLDHAIAAMLAVPAIERVARRARRPRRRGLAQRPISPRSRR